MGEAEAAYLAADPYAAGKLVFAGTANDARERAMVRRLAQGELSIVILGGAHDLAKAVREVGGCEYFRVTVEGYPDLE